MQVLALEAGAGVRAWRDVTCLGSVKAQGKMGGAPATLARVFFINPSATSLWM